MGPADHPPLAAPSHRCTRNRVAIAHDAVTTVDTRDAFLPSNLTPFMCHTPLASSETERHRSPGGGPRWPTASTRESPAIPAGQEWLGSWPPPLNGRCQTSTLSARCGGGCSSTRRGRPRASATTGRCWTRGRPVSPRATPPPPSSGDPDPAAVQLRTGQGSSAAHVRDHHPLRRQYAAAARGELIPDRRHAAGGVPAHKSYPQARALRAGVTPPRERRPRRYEHADAVVAVAGQGAPTEGVRGGLNPPAGLPAPRLRPGRGRARLMARLA